MYRFKKLQPGEVEIRYYKSSLRKRRIRKALADVTLDQFNKKELDSLRSVMGFQSRIGQPLPSNSAFRILEKKVKLLRTAAKTS